MVISDLEMVVENPSGSYKKFADSLDEYPILGVTYPTHYGFIKGFQSEDGHDLDVFIGNGDIYGSMRVQRDEIPGGLETKVFFGINKNELAAINKEFHLVIKEVKTCSLGKFLELLRKFKVDKQLTE